MSNQNKPTTLLIAPDNLSLASLQWAIWSNRVRPHDHRIFIPHGGCNTQQAERKAIEAATEHLIDRIVLLGQADHPNAIEWLAAVNTALVFDAKQGVFTNVPPYSGVGVQSAIQMTRWPWAWQLVYAWTPRLNGHSA